MLNGIHGFIVTFCGADGQQRASATLHKVAYMSKIDIDQTGLGDQL
ncbi:hypothetical protein SDC9_164247 [bioreactor metagenome]|uniref:Uncharacterized protein n=1 Tax=bioreactor metagenome TaxID=1076179 RepID=A0A645FSM9_9ZZZZ